jgi:uncharacterized protein (TIGR04255 family)
MATTAKRIPERLKHDAIVEAILEIRFDTSTIPEVLIGRLADYGDWKEFKQHRLPAYEIPEPVRQLDANLRFTPIFELRDEPGNRAVRIGSKVLSYHQRAPYVGWSKFKPELINAVDGLFQTTPGITVKRLGFRYVNALRSDLHRIRSISDLDLRIAVEGNALGGSVNLNYYAEIDDETRCIVRVASKEFVTGATPESTSVVADVDVFTKEPFKTKDSEAVKTWLEVAHSGEKREFFRLLSQDTINLLTEK